MWFFPIILVLFVLGLCIGFRAGRLAVGDECMTRGGFSVSGYDYSCLAITKSDDPTQGRPECLWNEDNGAFAEPVLDKLKFLTPAAKEKLKTIQETPQNIRRPLFSEHREFYDCVQCHKDAGVIQHRMVLCPQCGNKRCPKAVDHRNNCTRSNAPGQVGGVPDVIPPQKKLDGSDLIGHHSSVSINFK